MNDYGTEDETEFKDDDSKTEIAVPEAMDQRDVAAEEEVKKREERRRNPSDLNDPGDQEAQDVGIPGGAGSGGDLADGGSGGVEKEKDREEDLRD